MSVRRIAIIGAGPVGLEAALRARVEGYDAVVYESATVGEHFRRYGPMRLFTPFHMNSTGLGRERLRAAGVKLPADEEILTGAELRERYLLPLARLEELSGVVVEGARVIAIARDGFTKARTGSRAGSPFLLRIQGARDARLERADAVIDASGVYATPNATGPSGLPAEGEERIQEQLESHLPDLPGEARPRYAGRRILLAGEGTAVRSGPRAGARGVPARSLALSRAPDPSLLCLRGPDGARRGDPRRAGERSRLGEGVSGSGGARPREPEESRAGLLRSGSEELRQEPQFPALAGAPSDRGRDDPSRRRRAAPQRGRALTPALSRAAGPKNSVMRFLESA